MSIRDGISPEILASAKRLTEGIRTGVIRKRTDPSITRGASSDFNEEKVYKNAEAWSDSGDFDKIITGAYERKD
jgi:hypothetical protein